MADPDTQPSSSRRPPTFQRALMSGAVSGVAVDFLLFPLDTVKTRIQSSQGFWRSGGFSGVYRGVGSVGMGSAPGAAAFFVSYETFKTHVPALLGDSAAGWTHMLSASGAEFISCLIRVPTEVVKSRTQTGAYGSGKGKGTWHSAARTWQYEGVRGFYRGFGITIAREIPFTSIQFPLYEALKTQLSRRYLGGRRPSPGEAAGCGMIAGGFAAAVTTPLDVVKTRVMLEAKTAAPSANGVLPPRTPSPSVLSFPPRLVHIFRTEGPAALFGGWQPRTLAISFGGAIFLGIYDFCVNFGREDPVATAQKQLK